MFGVRGFRVSPGHFAERFSLIVIIALGESIVAVGAGVSGDLDAGIVTGAIFGLVLACALWWAYFDVIVLVAERRFRSLQGHERLRVARDAYSYLHLPMVAGIVLIALGIKKTIAHVDEPLDTVPAVALFGGVALYHGAHVAFRLRLFGTVNRAAPAHRGGLPAADLGGHRGRCAGGARAGRRGGLGRDRLRGAEVRGHPRASSRRARGGRWLRDLSSEGPAGQWAL